MKSIFDEVVIDGLSFRNRLMRSATWEGIAAPDGSIPEVGYEIYDELAAGGVGAVITDFTSVMDNDRYFDGMMRLSNDALLPQYARLAEVVHAHGCPIIAQLALGAYYREMPNDGIHQVEPDDMTVDEVHAVVDAFVLAAARARKADFDGVQIHVAHFFFLSRFVSPAANHRTDAYGGDTAGRCRILTEIVRGIRAAAPGLRVSAKVNSSDFIPGGVDEDEALAICRELVAAGVGMIEVSGNGTSVAGVRPHRGEAYFAGFAARLAGEVDVPVALVGGLRSLDVMQEALDRTGVEVLSLSRPLLREPDLPLKLQRGETTESACVSCNACYSSDCHRCIFRRRG